MRQYFRSSKLRFILNLFAASAICLTVIDSSARAATREDSSTATAQSENFVVTAPDITTAKAVLASAESFRIAIAKQWLGERLPDGIAPTVIRVTLSQEEDKAMTWVADHADRLSHMMWLTTSLQKATGTTLAHEMTHVVLASRYPGQLPAWIDEGIASRQDDPERAKARQEILAWYARTGNWPALQEMFMAPKIAASDRTKYALSASVTDYLLSLQSSEQLLNFALAGKEQGWDAALRTHYNIANTRELEIRWRRWASR